MKTYLSSVLFLCTTVLAFSQDCFSPAFEKAYNNYSTAKEKWNKENQNHAVSNTAQTESLSDNLLSSLIQCSKDATTLTDCITVLFEINHGSLAGFPEDKKERLSRLEQQMDQIILRLLGKPALIQAIKTMNQEVGVQVSINAMGKSDFQLKFRQPLSEYAPEMVVFILLTIDDVAKSPFTQQELDRATSKINHGMCSALIRLLDEM